MKQIRVERRGHNLVAADPYSLEMMEAFPEGKPLSVEVKSTRSRGELNLYWAGLALLVDNFDSADEQRWPTARKYHEAMLKSLGYVSRLYYFGAAGPGQQVDAQGYRYTEEVDSVAFDNMDDADFKVLFERVRKITVALFGYDPWDAWKEAKEQEAKGRDWRRNRQR